MEKLMEYLAEYGIRSPEDLYRELKDLPKIPIGPFVGMCKEEEKNIA